MTGPGSSLLLAVFAGVSTASGDRHSSPTDFRVGGHGSGLRRCDIRLVGPDGGDHRREDFKGRVTVLLFGFTHCPDICPTTLLNLSAVLDQLGDDQGLVQIAFIAVDPERDTRKCCRTT